MSKNKPLEILGLVTARAGSKRLPHKNTIAFIGKPLVEWTYACLKESQYLQNWILSTDDKKAIDIAADYPIRVPFRRPKEYATDESTSFEVVKHTLDWLKINEHYVPDWIILLEPTSPGRQPFHIDDVVKIITDKSEYIDSICGVSKSVGNFSAYKSLIINEKQTLEPFLGDVKFSEMAIRNQLVKPSYYINSVIYAFKSSIIQDPKYSNLWGDKVYAYKVDEKYACDIDTKEDLIMAESKIKLLMPTSSQVEI